ncbi:MAG: hypothetical protein ABIY70_28470 [Capsulimonas sp.]|uniref:hypothetical protein n=1 Tax=Capsulimonas sp. TaxID=2494211 RepID=UPI003267BDF6
MKFAGPIVVILVLIAALSFLSKGMNSNARPDHDEDEQQQSQAKEPPKPAPPGARISIPSRNGDPIPSEEQIGDPATAKHKIVVGWTYTPENQAATQNLNQTLAAVRKIAQDSHGAVSVQVVNVDVPAADRSPAAQSVNDVGIMVDGKSVGLDDNPGSGSTIPPVVMPKLAPLAH